LHANRRLEKYIRDSATGTPVANNERHCVYIYFQCRNGWHCQFMEADLKTALPRKLQLKSADKVIELVERGGGFSLARASAETERSLRYQRASGGSEVCFCGFSTVLIDLSFWPPTRAGNR